MSHQALRLATLDEGRVHSLAKLLTSQLREGARKYAFRGNLRGVFPTAQAP